MTAMSPLRSILNDTPATAVDVDWNFQTVEDFIANDVIKRDGSTAMEAPLNLLGPPASQPTHAVTKGYVDANVIPIATIWQFAGDVAPASWAICDGAEKSSTDPAWVPLFNIIGYKYGQNGTNFKLPDFRARGPIGRLAGDALFGSLGQQGGSRDVALPSHSHNVNAHAHYVDHSHNAYHGHTGSSGTESADHAHSGTTDAQGAHNHNVGGGLAWGFYGGGTLGMDTSGTGHSGAPSNLGDISTQPAHQHNFSTGGRNAAHTHGITVDAANFNTGTMNGRTTTDNTATTTDAQGGAVANTNYSPYTTVNFIIRIG